MVGFTVDVRVRRREGAMVSNVKIPRVFLVTEEQYPGVYLFVCASDLGSKPKETSSFSRNGSRVPKEGRKDCIYRVCECSSLVCLSIPYWRCVCAEDVMEVGKRDGRIERGKEIRCMSFVFCRANTALEF